MSGNAKHTKEKAHARFSPSSAKRWLACPGSIQLSELAPPQPESKYANEGTEAHTLLEIILKEHLTPKGSPYTQIRAFKQDLDQDQTMVDHVVNTFETIKTLIPHDKCEVLSETKSRVDFIHEEFHGTADAVIIEHFGRLTVIDFKYGAGVAVEAHDNEQMAAYALGIAHKYGFDFTECEMVIIQPRATHRDGPVRSWRLSMDELEAWSEKFKAGIEAALDPFEAPLKSGDHCRWCPAKTICPEVSTRALAKARVEFSPIEGVKLPKASGIQVPHLGPTLDALEQIEVWGDAVREHATGLLEAGEKIEGWRLVDKRAQRVWADPVKAEKEAKKRFGPVAFRKETLSPAQLEKAVPTSFVWVDARVSYVSSGKTLAREKDTLLFDKIPDNEPALAGVPKPKTKKGGSMPKKKTKRTVSKKRATKKKTPKKRKK